MSELPPLSNAVIERLAKALGDTTDGLSNAEIGRLLSDHRFEDPGAGITKWKRLDSALRTRQTRDCAPNGILALVKDALAPVRYASTVVHEARRAAVNEALAFVGLEVTSDGELLRCTAARTVTAAQQRTRTLKDELLKRSVHPDVLKCCREELLQDNFFHAILEATKSVAAKFRERSGLDADGSALVDQAFGIGAGTPLLALNTLQTQTERSEQTGLMNLMKGMFSAFRNPTAHELREHWEVNEEDAKDLLALVSLLHRRLDKAVRTRT